MNAFSRYDRQIKLPEIGQAGQEKLSKASVLCAGAGGLGSPALLYLAGAGVGHIGMIDHDTVCETNLHRQILFSHADIGSNKADVAARKITALNPEIEVQAYQKRLSQDNAADLIGAYDLILDGSDNFATKFLINDVCVSLGKPFVYASVLGFQGQVALFDPASGGPCYRCLFPDTPPQEVLNCADNGVLGPVAGMIGAMQAAEAIKYIVKTDERFKYELLLINFNSYRIDKYVIEKDRECKACGNNKQENKVTENRVQYVTSQDLKGKEGITLIDVREPDEWDDGYIPGAIHLPLSGISDGSVDIMQVIESNDQDIVIYCRSGQRSEYVAQMLIQKGYHNVYNVIDGYLGWSKT